MREVYDVIIIGGGVSGLTLAYALKDDFDVCLIEGNEIGGKILTATIFGRNVELGPEEIIRTKQVDELIKDLGLADRIVEPRTTSFSVIRDGRFFFVPPGVAGGVFRPSLKMLRSILDGLFDLSTLLSILREPLKGITISQDVSVKELFTAIYGDGFVKDFFEAVAGGIYAGDISEMSSEVYFPYILQIKKNGGSVLRNMIKKGLGFELFSISGGINLLVNRLRERISARADIVYAYARAVEAEGESYIVSNGGSICRGRTLALTVPPYQAPFVRGYSDKLMRAKSYIKSSNVAVIVEVYPEMPPHYREISGALTFPQVYGVSGLTYYDTKWATSSSDGLYTVKYFVPFNSHLDEEAALKRVRMFRDKVLRIHRPLHSVVKIWTEAMPTYAVGSRAVLHEIGKAAMSKGVFLGGPWMLSTGIASSIGNAMKLSHEIKKYFNKSSADQNASWV
ncbi:MAG: protoporphyrinogen oxidase [Nitrososphaeria archaeon]